MKICHNTLDYKTTTFLTPDNKKKTDLLFSIQDLKVVHENILFVISFIIIFHYITRLDLIQLHGQL